MISAQFWALPRGGIIVPLPDVRDYTISPMVSGAGSVEFDYPLDGRNFNVLHNLAENDTDLEIEIWLDGTAATAERAILMQAEGDENADGGTWKFSGNFLYCLLGDAVLPYSLGGVDADEDGVDEVGETKFQAATAGTIWSTIMAAAQARGALTGIDYSSFTATHDTNGQAWVHAATVAWSPGRSYLEIADDLEDRGFCEIEMTSARALHIYNPGTRGVDRTVGGSQVTLERGRDQLDAPRRHSVREAGTTLLASGKAIYHEETNADALARRGRRIERYVSYNDVTDLGSLTALTQLQVTVLSDGTSEQSHELVLADGHPLPRQQFNLADWVWSSTRSGLKRRRVSQWSLSRSGADVKVAVTLDDLIDDRNVRISRELAALKGGTTAVGTPTPPTTVEAPAKTPHTPTGLVVDSTAYQEAGPPTVIASTVAATCSAVTTHQDGTPIASTPFYRVRYRYLTGPGSTTQQAPYPPLWLATPGDGYKWLAGGESATPSVSFSGLSPALGIEVQIAAVIRLDPEKQPYELDAQSRSFRRTELQSAWSAGVSVTTGNDATAPSAPSTPVVTPGVADMLRVAWDGNTAAGADMLAANPDWSYVEVHLSAVNNFVPDATTYRDVLFGAGSVTITDTLLYGVTYYARLISVDLTGNRSTVSAVASGSPAQLADGDLASLNVGKLVSGIMTADLLLAGRIKTANSGARIEMDSASFRQYDSTGLLRTQFIAATGAALVTGTLQSALTGERYVISPDGDMRLYPATGTNYNAMLNMGNELVFRGQLDGSSRSGYLRLSALGVATQFGVPGAAVTAQLSVGSGNVDITSPINGLRVDKRYATTSGVTRCNVFLFADAGADIAGSVIQHREWNADAVSFSAPGRNANILFNNSDSKAIQFVYNDGNYADLKCGNVYAPNVTAPSGLATKQNVRPVEFEPLEVVRGAPSKAWQYRDDVLAGNPPDDTTAFRLRRRKGRGKDTGKLDDHEYHDMPAHTKRHQPKPSTTDRVGPIADDIRAIAPSLVTTLDDGNLALSMGDLVGVLWSAVAELAAKLDALTDKHDDIPELPGRALAEGAA